VCSIARTLDVVGEKWSLLALREVFLGYRRFDQMVANTGAPRDILTARLRKLVDAGELDRVQYSERPPRFEYVLTETGRDLHPVLMALMHFGDRHLSPGDRPPVEWTHNGDHVLKPELTCAECAGSVTPETLRAATPAR
jgi:DNA-binding HxlR family transcriptional regulator